MPVNTQINIRRDTAANFTSANPTLALGEIAYETDTFRFKVGTGSTAWTALGYAAQNPTSLTVSGGMTVTPNANAPTSNVTIGPSAGAAMQSGATNNVCIGSLSGDALTSGIENTAVGYNALSTAQSSGSNSAFGANALANNLAGGSNTAIGANAMLSNQSGSSNVAIGVEAFQSNTSGGTNCAIGRAAGRYRGSGTSTLTSATSSVFIGYQSRAADNAQTNQVVIAGIDGLGNGSDTTTIGNSSTTGTFIPNGNLTLSNGNLILGTAGSGIDFSATTDPTIPAVAATGAITRTSTNVSDGDTVTLGSQVYTFKTTLTPADYEVLIGADAAASLTNLANAINGTGGTPGTDYQVPAANASASAGTITGVSIQLTALATGTSGNSIALAETSAQLSVSAATLVGGRAAQGTTGEVLDDYETGTWTPSVSCATTDFDSKTIRVEHTAYTKIGKVVIASAGLIIWKADATNAAGNLLITGLPYAVEPRPSGTVFYPHGGYITHATNWSNAPSSVVAEGNTSQAWLNKRAGTSALTGLAPMVGTDIGGSNTQFAFTIMYRTP